MPWLVSLRPTGWQVPTGCVWVGLGTMPLALQVHAVPWAPGGRLEQACYRWHLPYCERGKGLWHRRAGWGVTVWSRREIDPVPCPLHW